MNASMYASVLKSASATECTEACFTLLHDEVMTLHDLYTKDMPMTGVVVMQTLLTLSQLM